MQCRAVVDLRQATRELIDRQTRWLSPRASSCSAPRNIWRHTSLRRQERRCGTFADSKWALTIQQGQMHRDPRPSSAVKFARVWSRAHICAVTIIDHPILGYGLISMNDDNGLKPELENRRSRRSRAKLLTTRGLRKAQKEKMLKAHVTKL